MLPGIRRDTPTKHQDRDDGRRGERRGRPRRCPGVRDEHFRTAEKITGDRGQLQAEEVANLGTRDQHADPVREPDHHRTRNELDRGAEARSRRAESG